MSSILIEPTRFEQVAPPEVRGPNRSRPWQRALFGFVLLWVLSGIYFVQPDQQAVVIRFGAVINARVLPGVHYSLPWPIDRLAKVKVHQQQRLIIGGDVADTVLGRTQPLASQFLTGDQNIIHMRMVIQYSVAVPVDYLFRSFDVKNMIGAAVEAELSRRIARGSVDALLTTEKIAVQDEVLSAAQKRLNDYHAGVKLSTVNIETMAPPPEAADAFRDVASARADTGRIINEARGYANDLLPRARGQAKQMTEAAEAYRLTKVNEAKGDAERFLAIASEYAKASTITGERLYMEAMEQILPRIRKLVLDSNGNVDLSIIRRGETIPAKP
jgi:modulator of FtsH protease HflK